MLSKKLSPTLLALCGITLISSPIASASTSIVCQGRAMYGKGITHTGSQTGYEFEDAKSCQDALNSSKSGFVCIESMIHGPGLPENGRSSGNGNWSCQTAVNSSNNGFVCVDFRMYGPGVSQQYGLSFSDARACLTALKASKNGLVCHNDFMFGPGLPEGGLQYSDIDACYAATKAAK